MKKIFSVFFALVLALSLSLVTAVPVAAADEYILYHSLDSVTADLFKDIPGTTLSSDGTCLKIEWESAEYGGVRWKPMPGYDTGQTYDLTGTTIEFDVLWHLTSEGRPTMPEDWPEEDWRGIHLRVYSAMWDSANNQWLENELGSSGAYWTGTGTVVYMPNAHVETSDAWVHYSYIIDVPGEDQDCRFETYDPDATEWWVDVGWENRTFDVTSVYKIQIDATNWDWTEGDYLLLDELKVVPPSEVWVDDEGNDSNPGTEATPFATIQRGINTVAPGGTVNVAAGTYTENVDVDKQVVIIGAGEVDTIVTAADWENHVFEVTADGVSISALTATGANRDSYKYRDKSGIFVDASGCTISSVTAEDNNVGIFLDHSVGSTVTGCTATNNIRFGIYLEWSDGNEISSNDASSNGQDGSWASTQSPGQIGIYLKYSANNELTGNTANSNIGGESTWGSSGSQSGIGIFLDKCETGWPQLPGNVLIGNTANDNDCLGDMPNTGIGIYLWQAGGTEASHTILTGNTANGNSSSAGPPLTPYDGREKSGSGIVLYQTHYADLMDNTVIGNQQNGFYSEGAIGNFVHDNIVTGTTATGNEIGFYLVNDASTYTSNTITGNTDGVRLDHYGGMSVTATALNYNNISDNGNYGVNNIGTDLLNAEKNWWGHATGADHADNPHGTGKGGDTVSDNVVFTPWYATSTTTANTQNVSVDHTFSSIIAYSDTIQGGIEAALVGDTINVVAGIYAEHIVITEPNLTLIGEDRETTIIDATQDSSWTVAKPGILIGEYPLVDGIHGVTVSGFTIKDAAMQEGGVAYAGDKYGVGPGGLAGIQIYNSSSNIIEDNILINNYWQIWLVAEWPAAGYTECMNNRIADNIIMDSENDGVYLYSDGGVFVQDTEIVNNEISNAYGENASGVEFWGWPEGGLTPTISGTIIRGNNITNCMYGVRIRDDVSDITGTLVRFNNFIGSTTYGVYNGVPPTLDATHNWWGNPNGPDAIAFGIYPIGDAVSDNVTYSPWIGAGVEDSTSEKTSDEVEVTVDAKDETDTEVVKKGSGTPTITVTEYTDNPGDGAPGGFSSVGDKYIDVHIDDITDVTEIEIRNYYTQDDIAGLAEATLKLSWWNGTDWIECSDSEATSADDPPYIGYVWAKIRAAGAISPTIPTLDDLAGAPFMPMGAPPTSPSIVTNAASSVTTTSATLDGNLSSLGTAISVDVSFEWGTTTAYGNETAIQTMASPGSFTASLTNLSSTTTYYFRVKAVGDGTSYGEDMSFTTAGVSGGGGGGGGRRRVPAGTTNVRGEISWEGVFEEPVTVFSDDELLTLTIPEGTVGLTEDLEPLDEITILREDEPPEPPEDADIVLAYDLGPDGATFDPAITLTLNYDPDDIPEGKDVLVVAYYDEVAEAWVGLVGIVDPATNTIIVSISHFTTFAIIAYAPPPPPAPAAFSVTDLSIEPVKVQPEEAVTISLSVDNTGGTEGSYTVVLKINGVKEAERSIFIAAGKSQDVNFSVAKEKAGSYSVVVDGLGASFTVVAPVPEAPAEEEEEEVVVPEAPAPAKPAINWPLLGAIIAALVVAGLLIFFLFRRRGLLTEKKKENNSK